MFGPENYLQIAKENEEIFKNVLQDLQDNRAKRAMGSLVPEKLNIQSTVDEIFVEYSTGRRYGIFTILNFEKKDRVVFL